MDKYIKRELYLEKLRIGRDDTGIIKIITGMRRTGKSVLMKQYIQELLDTGTEENDVHFFDFESYEGQKIKTYEKLNEILEKTVSQDHTSYVFFDEIQNVDKWELSISALSRSGTADIYITGSNSEMLSSQLATHLSGRHIQIEVFPLSLKEFVELNGYSDLDKAFSDYLAYGGLPAVDPERGLGYARDYLKGVYSTVIIEDVLRHVRAVNPSKVEAIAKFLFSNIGNETNTSKIASSTKFGTNTVDGYLSAMAEAFLFSYCPRYDIAGKKLLNTNGKYYATDIGLRNAVLGLSAGTDISRPLENIVYLELRRKGYDVQVGSYRDKEIDFIARKNDVIEYFQICQTLMSEGTRERETRSLLGPKDNYMKTILTLDRFGLGDESGIKIRNVLDWLMERWVPRLSDGDH